MCRDGLPSSMVGQPAVVVCGGGPGFGGAVQDKAKCRSWSSLWVRSACEDRKTKARCTFHFDKCCESMISLFCRTVGTDGCG